MILSVCFLFPRNINTISYAQTPSSEIFNPRVLLIGLNPEENGRKLAETFYSWIMGGKSSGEVENLIAQKTVSAFQRLSENTIQYSIAKTIRLNKFPTYSNGFVYNFNKFEECTTGDSSGNCERQKSQFDHEKWVIENRICEIAQENNIDEIWLVAPPLVTAWESFMIGPREGFFVNGPFYTLPNCTKNYVVMTANYDRLDTILHIYGHRVESTLGYISSFWKEQDKNKYILNFLGWNQKQSTTIRPYPSPFCGDAHYPSNGITDYDYGNYNFKDSTCIDWKNFPLFKGETTSVNCHNWNCNDSDWQEYWLGSLPRNSGETEMVSKNEIPFRMKNNWWYYLLYPENAVVFRKLTQGIISPSPTLVCSGQYFGKSQCTSANRDKTGGSCQLNPKLGYIDPSGPNYWKWSWCTASSVVPTSVPVVPTVTPTSLPRPTPTSAPLPNGNCSGQYFGKLQCNWANRNKTGGSCQLNPLLGDIDPNGPNYWRWSWCTEGSANRDDKIDGVDFEIWREEFLGLKTTQSADFNHDSKIDGVDFEIWRENRN